MKPPTQKRPRRLSLHERWQRTLWGVGGAEFAAFLAESDRLIMTHPDLPPAQRCFRALAAVRARRRAAAEAA
jgi:hypothetical protein